MASYSLAGEPVARGRLAGALGVCSSLLLAASVRWAHHWGPLTDSIVAGWALSTVSAFVVSVWAFRTSHAARRPAKLGIALGILSVLVLGVAGIVSAMGGDVAGACGGG
jgi:hypothetical protein